MQQLKVLSLDKN